MRKVKPEPRSCKIGTMPALVILTRNYKVAVGKVMIVRDWKHGSQPFKVKVIRVNDDGYFFADRG